MEEDSSLRRALDLVPRPIRVAGSVALLGLVVYDRVKWRETSEAPAWVLVVEGLVVVVGAAFGAILLSRTFGAPDRRPLEPTHFWMAYFMITGSCLVLGPWSVFDGDPKTTPVTGLIMFAFGVVLAVLFVRLRAKPVRGGYPRPTSVCHLFEEAAAADAAATPADSTDDGPDIGRWHLAAKRANEARSRRTDHSGDAPGG